MTTKCFGIPSWLPDTEPARTQRENRLNRLLNQLSTLWPEIDILIIAQNWKDFQPLQTKNKQIIKYFEPLGILQARKTLREEFLELGYDYLIMLDDDAIIRCDSVTAHIEYMNELDKHPNGFCFIHGKTQYKYDNYKAAQLNLCAISRFIYSQEPMVNIDPQKNQGYEDHIFSILLHLKWGQYEFIPPQTITHIQFLNSQEPVPSTWSKSKKINYKAMNFNVDKISDYIAAHKDMPQNTMAFLSTFGYKEIKPIEDQADGRKNAYLYF